MLAVAFLDYLSAPAAVQHLHLAQFLSQIEPTGANFLLEINGMQFQFVNFDEHQTPSPRRPPVPRDPRKQPLKSKFSSKQKSRIKGVERGVKEGSVGAGLLAS